MTLLFLIKKTPFELVKTNCLNLNPASAKASQSFTLKVKAYQRAAFLVKFQTVAESVDSRHIQQIPKEDRIPIPVNRIVYD